MRRLGADVLETARVSAVQSEAVVLADGTVMPLAR